MSNLGPRSTAGKAALANNSLKHGLTAAAIVLPSESADDWEGFHDDVRARFDAEGAVEIALASRVAELLWRLRRIVRAEEQFVSVAQMHRDVLELDDKEVARLRLQSAAEDQSAVQENVPPRQLASKQSFYAGAIIAGEASSAYKQTLPVLLSTTRTSTRS